MNRIFIACLLVGAIGGCTSETHSIEASEFQRSCAVDSDCVAVSEGTITCCGISPWCPSAAVNQVGYSAYESAVAARTPTCSPRPPCALLRPACFGHAICSNGTCTFEPAAPDASTAD
jgi:hypothetical protein